MGSNYLTSIRHCDVLKMLIGHTDETCPIIILIIDGAAKCVEICAHTTFWVKTNRHRRYAFVCVCVPMRVFFPSF